VEVHVVEDPVVEVHVVASVAEGDEMIIFNSSFLFSVSVTSFKNKVATINHMYIT